MLGKIKKWGPDCGGTQQKALVSFTDCRKVNYIFSIYFSSPQVNNNFHITEVATRHPTGWLAQGPLPQPWIPTQRYDTIELVCLLYRESQMARFCLELHGEHLLICVTF
jgi:hypothetical protein